MATTNNYFNNCKTSEELKATYKALVKKYHPDIYGEKGNDILKEVHNQLEKAVRNIDKAYNISDYIDGEIKETPEELARKKELLEQAKKYLFREGALFGLYWQNGLRPANHRNPLTKHNFSGWNIWSLEIKRLEKGYTSSEWSTFAQYKNEKQSVRKGEKSTYLTLAIYTKGKKSEETEDDEDQKGRVYYKGYSVFNKEQVKELARPMLVSSKKQIETKKETRAEKTEQTTLNLWQEKYEVVA